MVGEQGIEVTSQAEIEAQDLLTAIVFYMKEKSTTQSRHPRQNSGTPSH
jgi:hypothetical protein